MKIASALTMSALTFAFTMVFSSASALTPAAAPRPASSPDNGNRILKLKPEIAAKIESAVHILQLSEERHCSASAINKKGDFLTALHCLRECLIEEGAMETSLNNYIGLYDLAVVTKASPQIAYCSKLKIQKLGLTGFDVIATGPALSSYSPAFVSSFTPLFEELKSEGFHLRANDFAIIRARSATVPNCLELEWRPTSGGLKIWSVGYVLARVPPLIPIFHTSVGSVYSSVEQSHYYSTRKTDDDRMLTRLLYADSNILYSSAATSPGQSGGPVVDDRGAILGVNSGFTTVRDGSRSIRELVAPTVPFVLATLPPALSKELLVGNRECR